MAALVDRRSVCLSQRRTLDLQHLQRAMEVRHQRPHLRHIAWLLAAPVSTVASAESSWSWSVAKPSAQTSGAALRAREAGRPNPHRRQEAGPLPQGGHGITGNRQHGCSIGVGYDRVNVAIGVVMRLAYVEVVAEE